MAPTFTIKQMIADAIDKDELMPDVKFWLFTYFRPR